MPVTLADIQAAHGRIRDVVHRTPVMTSRHLDQRIGASLYFKCENFQRVGAFKFRGATNAVRLLPEDEAERGVVTHSSGNHAQALALAARQRGIPAWIVMPADAPSVKRAAVEGYGAEVVSCAPTLEARESTAADVQARTGATFVHPYDDDRIIAGAGTAALELLEEVPDLDVVIAPVGGGGLLSGTSIAVRGLRPEAEILAAEPARADDAWRSLDTGRLVPAGPTDTCADGLKTSLAPRTFEILREHVSDVLLVTEEAIRAAMHRVWERMKIVIEPSSATVVAALERHSAALAGRRVGAIFSGGNVDLRDLPFAR